MQQPVTKPPCAEWSLWKGPEIEGNASKGVQTLFIRSLASFPSITPESDLTWLRERSRCNRVWFCKEFYLRPAVTSQTWKLIESIAKVFEEAVIEIRPEDFDSLPVKLRATCRLFVKVDLNLKPGDHVCVGPAYADEAFEVGQGVKVKPEDYLKDIKIV